MGLSELLRMIRRRWLIVLPIVVAGLVIGGFMMLNQRPLYRADLAIALVADPVRGQDATLRQFWDQNGSRIAPALGAAMVEELRSPEVQKVVGGGQTTGNSDIEPGVSTSFAVDIPEGEYLYRLSALAYDGNAAAGAVEEAAGQAADAVNRLQKRAAAPSAARYRTVTVGAPGVVRASASRSLRMPLAVVAGSLMAGLLAGALVDSASTRRSRVE